MNIDKQEFIKVTKDLTIDNREQYTDWIKRMISYGFVKGADYSLHENMKAILAVKKAKDEEIRLSEEYKEKQRAANMGPDFYAQVKEKEDLEKIKTQKELDSFLKIYNDK